MECRQQSFNVMELGSWMGTTESSVSDRFPNPTTQDRLIVWILGWINGLIIVFFLLLVVKPSGPEGYSRGIPAKWRGRGAKHWLTPRQRRPICCEIGLKGPAREIAVRFIRDTRKLEWLLTQCCANGKAAGPTLTQPLQFAGYTMRGAKPNRWIDQRKVNPLWIHIGLSGHLCRDFPRSWPLIEGKTYKLVSSSRAQRPCTQGLNFLSPPPWHRFSI